ncbi:MAG: PA14 domain-containing protein, partial [Kiritimatiellaeota bacterium]|nr:PA14 domain-containing protein [Kiritimatiellota bacterium]
TTTVSNGWLMMSSDSALGSGGDIRILNGSRLMLNAEGIPPTVATRLTPDSEGFLILGGQCAGLDIDLTGRPGVYVGTDQDRLDYWGALTPAGSEYHLGGGGVNYWMTGNHGLVLANLQGARAAVIQGAGVVRLAAGNTHTGGTVVTNRGVLFLREDAGLGAVPASPDPSNVFVDGGVVRNADMWFEVHENRGWAIGPGGAEFHPWGGNQMVIKGDLSGTGDILLTDSGTIVLGGAANTWTGGLDLRNGATVQIGWETNFSWERDNLIFGNGGWLALYCEGPIAYSDFFGTPLGADGDRLGLRKRGPGTLLLDVDQQYAWDTLVEGGALQVGSQGAIPAAGNVQVGATLDLNGWTVDIGAITGTGEIIDSAGGAQSVGVGANNASATFTGSVAPDITLRKVGTGNQTLNTSGVNNAEVLQGTLTTVNPTAPTGTIAIASGATLAAIGGGLPYTERQGRLLARYYDHNPGPDQFDTPEKIFAFLEQRTPSLITTSASAGDTLDFGYANDNGDGYCRFEPPYDHEPRNQFVACFSGTFRAEATGTYTFGSRSDDGSLVFVDGQCVVDNNDWGGWYGNLASGEVFLEAGEHAFMVFFYEGGGGHGLTVYMAPPGVTAEWEDQNDYSQPILPQSLLAAMAPSRWNLSDADGANIALSANGAVEIGVSANTTLTGGTITGDPGTALVKTGSGTLTLAPDRFEMQGAIVTTDGTLALDGPGNVGDLVIGEGTTLRADGMTGEGVPFTGSGLTGKYYDVWPPNEFPAFDELDTYEAYLAPHQPAMTASTLLAGDTFYFGWNGEHFPPPFNAAAEGFQVLWKGRIQLPEDDDYTFYTRSDDGSMLFIDGTAIVRNNAMQGMEERSGTVLLTAGWHDIAITYYQGGGGYGLYAEIEGGGMPRQNIPNRILFPLPTDVTDASWLGAGLTASGTLTGSGTFALDGEGTAVNLNITGNCTFGGGAAGAASTVIFKTGPAALTLTGDHSAFHGTWVVLEGELRLADGAVLGSEVFIDSASALSLDGDATLLGKITGSGTLRFSGNGTATFGDLSEFLGTIETEPGQSIALTGGTLIDAARLADFAEVILLDGATLYCFDPADLPASLVSSNGLLILNVTDANKNLWDMDRLTVMAGSTQQVTACTSGLFGYYYDLPDSDDVRNDLRDAFESFETAEGFLAQHTHSTTVSTWYYGDALYCGGTNNDCWHPAPYVPGYENFAVTWKGKVRILEAGLYTFATRSDDNSMLFIDGRVVVHNNYSQPTTLRSGTIALNQGLHDIAILFAQGGSGHWMEALIQRPGDPDLIPLPNDMLFADLGDTAVYASIPPYTLTAATVAVQNSGHGTVGMLMGGTLAFSGLWIDTDAVLDVSGAAKIAGPTLTVEIPEDIPKGGKPVLVADFIQASGLNLSGAAFLPVIGSQDARVFYRNQQLFLTRTQGTVMILR